MMKVLTLCSLLLSVLFYAQDYEILKLKPFYKTKVSDTLAETSALAFTNQKLFSLNDSGNLPEIYQLNPNNGSIEEVLTTDIPNVDWEAIAYDKGNFYIGDFGDNLGKRQDLTIYQLSQPSEEPKLTLSKKIEFYYPEQKSFVSRNMKHNFDAEAMIFLDNKVHVFTKEWESKKTSHYVIDPIMPNKQAAQKVEEVKIGFVVTDASYHQGKLYLIGYTKGMEVYLVVADEDEKGLFFSQPIRKYFLGSTLSLGQIEGIATTDEGLYISGEEFNLKLIKAQQSLYFLPYNKLK
ncbi:hypothetical protein [Elizabethkingia sp. JS20170427COW]|uniref:hypothetical protein n=1 Tax=Elizabethkingia sp. JS20170427COW TaxID=2583851 RepID=UPI0021060E13|nr:hypothetical protein [Elizabethkingia sp. JS20170427COW]